MVLQLYHRKALNLEANDFKVTTCVHTGFPQGGVCSAKFWIIALDPTTDIIDSNGIFRQGFADDCAATDLKDLTMRMNEMFNKLVTWGATCGLHFNPSKPIVLHKNYCERNCLDPTIQMSGQTITQCKHTRYLVLCTQYPNL